MKNIILTMSLAGSIIIIIYIILYPLIKYRFKAQWKYNILKLSLVFYLLPISSFKYILLGITNKVYPLNLDANNEVIYNLNQRLVIYRGNDTISFSTSATISIFFNIICIAIMGAVLLYEIINFMQAKKIFMRSAYPATESELQILKKIKKEMGVNQEIKLLKSKYSSLILNMGVFQPIIFLPEKLQLDTQELTYILCHELSHIKHKDIVWYFLGAMVISLHWFNPIARFLLCNIYNVSELYSDEIAVLNLRYKDRLKYCNTLIHTLIVIEPHKFSKLVINFSTNSRKQIEERIDGIMKQKEKSKSAATILGFTTFILSINVVFSYNAPLVLYANENHNLYNTTNNNSTEFITKTLQSDSNINISNNNYFINKNNQIYEIKTFSEYALCNHDYEEGTVKNHSKKTNGSCVTDYYNAKRCILCGEVRTGDLYKTETYTKCPH